MKKAFFLLLGTAMMLVLVACGGANISTELVGTWLLTSDTEWEFVLNRDGSGTRNGDEISWSTEDGVLTFMAEGESEIIWSYEVESNLLTLTNETLSLHFIHADEVPSFTEDHAVIGVWQNTNNRSDLLVLEPGGEGVMGSESDDLEWWIVADRLIINNFSMETIVMVFYYEINGEILSLTSPLLDDSWEFQWLGEDLDSVVFPTDMLEDIDFAIRLAEYTNDLEFDAIVDMIDEYLAETNATEEDIAHEIRELAVRASELLDDLYIYEDSFDGDITLYHPGVREISSDINVVPYIRPGGRVSPTRPRATANFHLDFGFYRNGWLFFDRASLRLSNDEIWDNNFGAFETNRDVIRGGTVREVGPKNWGLVNHNSVGPRLFNNLDTSYDHVLRFTDRREDNHYDVTLSNVEIEAVAAVAELYWIMGQLGHSILDNFH